MTTKLVLADAKGEKSQRDLTFAVAFGAGGARGLAHAHVIDALDELGIRPVAIAGSSMGAIMGAGMAAGMTGSEIRAYTLETVGNRGALANRLLSLGPSSMRGTDGGFRFGQFNIEHVLKALLPQAIPADFQDLGIPLKVIATDYYGRSEVVLEEGSLGPALAASAAIPGIFMPVTVNGRIMVDGGIFNPVPYDHLMDLADVVIGVDVVGAPEGDGLSPPSRMESIFGANQLMMQSTISFQLKLQPPHVLLRPPVNHFRVMDFLKAKDIFDYTLPVKEDLKRAVDAIHLAARA